MRKGVTRSGFKFEIDENLGDDMEFFEILAAADTNHLLMPKVIEEALGADQKSRLYEHLRGENGKVSTQRVMEEFTDILNKAGEEIKNS